MKIDQNGERHAGPRNGPLVKRAEPGVRDLLAELGVAASEPAVHSLAALATQLCMGLVDEAQHLAQHRDKPRADLEDVEAVCGDVDSHFKSMNETAESVKAASHLVNHIPLPKPSRSLGLPVLMRDALAQPDVRLVDNLLSYGTIFPVVQQRPVAPQPRPTPVVRPCAPTRKPEPVSFKTRVVNMYRAKERQQLDPKTAFQQASKIKLIVHNTSSNPNSPVVPNQGRQVFTFADDLTRAK